MFLFGLLFCLFILNVVCLCLFGMLHVNVICRCESISCRQSDLRCKTPMLCQLTSPHPSSSSSPLRNRYTGTPSPMSPTPSPAGSVGSVGSLGSQGSNNGEAIGNTLQPSSLPQAQPNKADKRRASHHVVPSQCLRPSAHRQHDVHLHTDFKLWVLWSGLLGTGRCPCSRKYR